MTIGADLDTVLSSLQSQINNIVAGTMTPAQLQALAETLPSARVRAISGRVELAATPGMVRAQIILQGAGGGGGGSGYPNLTTIGQRGGDTAFDTLAPEDVTITTGATTTINWTGHPLVDSQPFWLTGTLPTGVLPGTATTGQVYYVLNGSRTANSFRISTEPYTPHPDYVQPEVVSSGSSSGVQAIAYRFGAQGGGPGKGIGDQGTPLSYYGQNEVDPVTGFLLGFGIQGGPGGAIAGNAVAGGAGGNGVFGGGGAEGYLEWGIPGTNQTGGGGAGGGAGNFPGAAGGASGSHFRIPSIKALPVYRFMVGLGGPGGLKASSEGYDGGKGGNGKAWLIEYPL